MNTTMTECVNTESQAAGDALCHQNGHAHRRRNANRVFTPRFDVWEGEDELVLYGELPGVAVEQLEITFANRTLTIEGKVADELVERDIFSRQYGIGDFRRVFRIGEAIDTSKIEATMEAGVLTLRLPKSENSKPRRISVDVR